MYRHHLQQQLSFAIKLCRLSPEMYITTHTSKSPLNILPFTYYSASNNASSLNIQFLLMSKLFWYIISFNNKMYLMFRDVYICLNFPYFGTATLTFTSISFRRRCVSPTSLDARLKQEKVQRQRSDCQQMFVSSPSVTCSEPSTPGK